MSVVPTSLKYATIIRQNNALKKQSYDTNLTVLLLSNVTIHLIRHIFEYALRSRGINPKLIFADYNTFSQTAASETGAEACVLFWEVCNLIEGLHYKIDQMSDSEVEDLEQRVKAEIDLTLRLLATKPLVLMNTFSASSFTHFLLRSSRLDILAASLNRHLHDNLPKNVQLVDLEKVFRQISVEEAVDFRDFANSRSLYTAEFFKRYVGQVLPFFLSLKGKAKKALIFDCDETLWSGIVGEDGPEGIQMSGRTPRGAAFEAVQSIVKGLARKGVIIGLCSKNNPEDIEAVIKSHPDFQLRDGEIVVKKVNWDNKTANLRMISEELNIGLDSMVYVDDSRFEVELVRAELPQVEVFQVPAEIHSYPHELLGACRLFFNLSESEEDRRRAIMYHEESNRRNAVGSFHSITDFLRSLALQADVYVNQPSLLGRIAQLTQKTNQFNLTTQRYSESEIVQFMELGHLVLAVNVQDRFGDSGITGVAIIRWEPPVAVIDTLLLSCRVLGRNVERALMDAICSILQARHCSEIHAEYIATAKNAQVQGFYDDFGFRMIHEAKPQCKYIMRLEEFQPSGIDYIKVKVHEG